ncbi:MAG: hypothetical protein QM758_22230 [Armatimonas sp.]
MKLPRWLRKLLYGQSSVIYKFQIPDPERPIPPEERKLGPSGVLIPFEPEPLDESKILGCRIEEISTIVGTYGMGGPGFFGLRFGEEWLVISIWGAASWILVDGRIVIDSYAEEYNRPTAWIREGVNELKPHLLGSTVLSIFVEKHRAEIRFSNGSVLEIDPGSERRPIFQGNGKSRRFLPKDDLRQAVFLAPTIWLWV